MRKNTLFTFMLLAFAGIITLYSCKKKVTDFDKEIFDKSKSKDGFTFYKLSSSILNKTAGSGHSDPKFVTRFNSEASQSLETSGKVKAGIKFAENSLIVKELYDKNDELTGYATMYKKTGNENADANGWVWGVYTADGKITQAASKKGSGCISCHAGGGNIDYSLMNISIP